MSNSSEKGSIYIVYGKLKVGHQAVFKIKASGQSQYVYRVVNNLDKFIVYLYTYISILAT